MKAEEMLREIVIGTKITKEMVDQMFDEEVAAYLRKWDNRGKNADHIRKMANMVAWDYKLTIMDALHKEGQIEKYVVLKTVDYMMTVSAFTPGEAEEYARNEENGWDHIGTDISVDEEPITYESED